jgi:hypothetical protein
MMNNLTSHQTGVAWEVQNYDLFSGWNTWVIYDNEHHARTECERRISESPIRDKKAWRALPKRPTGQPTAQPEKS